MIKITTVGKTTKIFGMVVLACGLLFASCEKKGEIGPAGANGANGADGNANVVSSIVTTSAWTNVSNYWQADFTYPAITSDIVDNGAVFIYIKNGTAYAQLPFTFFTSSTYSSLIDFEYYLGGFSIYSTDSDLTTPANPGTKTFKVVVISASQRMANPSVNFHNYNEVKNAFNLKD
jgi:hypothetical protein